MDIARNLLSEFLVLNLWNGEWNELRQARKKKPIETNTGSLDRSMDRQ